MSSFIRSFFFVLLLTGIGLTVQAQQEQCGTMLIDSIKRASHPNAPSLRDFENWLQGKIQDYERQSTLSKTQVISIPVVVHVVHNGDGVGQGENISKAQIYSQIDVLNEDFRRLNSDTANTPASFKPVAADIKIEFCLAQVDPQGNVLAEPGIHRYNGGQATWGRTDIENNLKPSTIWDPNRYFNVWTVDFGNNGLLGFAQFPEASGLQGMPTGAQNAQTDGIVVRYNAFGRTGNLLSGADLGRTATHEVGHWLGLRHIWGDGGCGVDDFCNDTPDSDDSHSGCPTGNTDCGSVDMVQNYMDYSDDACMNLFTQDQKSRMRTVINNSPRRVDLLTSNVCQVLDKKYISGQVVDSANGTGIANAEVLIGNNSFNFFVQTDNNGFFSDSVFESTYNVYAGKWGYVTNELPNVPVQNDTSGLIIKLAQGYYDDFLFDFGWSENSTATTGIWEKGDPLGTFFNGAPSNPENDVQQDFGSEAFVTGNSGGSVGNDDVDDGVTTVTSPVFDLSSYNNPYISYYRWFFNDGGNTAPNDSLVVRLTDGNSTVTIESLDTSNQMGQWLFNKIRVSDYLNPAANMQIIFETADQPSFGHLVEGAFDLFRVVDSTATNTAPIAKLNANPRTVCRGDTVSFFDNSTNSPTGWDWRLFGGIPNSSTTQNPNVVYTTPGAYDVTLIASNSHGVDTITKTDYITVDSLQADFISNKTKLCPGEVAQFTSQSTCNPSSYEWFFPNANPASSANSSPSVSYGAAGTYDVGLVVSNQFGSDTVFKQNYITVQPARSLPFQEDFESGSFANNNWQTQNPDNGFTWELQSVNGNNPGNTAARVNCFAYTDVGQRDGLVTPPLDFSNSSNITLTFEHAYRRSSTADSDSLIIYLSTNCGVSYPFKIFADGEDGSGTFATNTTTNTDWVPSTTDDWCLSGIGSNCDTVDLSAFSGNPNVRLKFQIYNDNGNNIYLDNINISGNVTATPPDAQFTSSSDSSCAPLPVTFTDQSTNNPTSWQWSFPGGTPSTSTAQNPSVTYNNPGNYTVSLIATNADGSDTITKQNAVTVYPNPQPIGSASDVACPGGADGSINVTVNTGTAPFTYQWSNNQTSQDISKLNSGTYTVTVSDANGCSGTKSFTITEPAAFATTVTPSPETCGQSDGSATINVTGGTTPYSYAWSNGQTGALLTGVSSGMYQVTVTDDQVCEVVDTVQISSINGPTLAAATSNANCFGAKNGSIDLTVTNGTAPYSYNWSSGDTTQDLSQLGAGNYAVTVADANGCTAFASYSITQPQKLQLSTSSMDASCGNADGSASVSVAGGTAPYSYVWSNNQTTATITNLTSGTYQVTVTDANGCLATGTASVSNNNGPSVTVSTNDVTCQGGSDGSATGTVTGGVPPFTFDWSTGDTTQTITGLSAGSYQLTVSDANNCMAVQSVSVNQPAALNLSLSKSDATCGDQDGSAMAQASGGSGSYSFQWSNGSTNASLSNLAPGGYSVTVTDSNGCSATSSVFINNIPGPTSAVTVDHPECHGDTTGTIDLQVSSGTPPYTYNWSNGATTQDLTSIQAGTYSVTVTDDTGCKVFQTVSVTQPSPITISPSVTDATCDQNNGKIDILVNGGTVPYSYNWSNGVSGMPPVTNLAPATYQVTVTDSNGCSATTNVSVQSISKPKLVTSKSNVTCYADSNGAAAVSVSSGGKGPFTFQWSSGQSKSTISGLGAGAYQVTVTDSLNCSVVRSISITQPPKITLNVSQSPDECGNGKGMIVASASGGQAPYHFQWSTGDTGTVLKNVEGGAYALTVTDAQNCSRTSSVQMQKYNQLQLTISSTPDTAGKGIGTATVQTSGGTAPYDYQWNDSDNQTTATATGLSTGAYQVTVVDSNGCQSVKSVIVDGITGIDNQELSALLEVYPNPTADQVTITLQSKSEELKQIDVFNTVGEKAKVIPKDELLDQQQKQLSLANFPNGLYFIRIQTTNGRTVKKVMLQK